MEREKYPLNHRRLRASSHMRELASRVTLTHRDFIQPLFVDESLKSPEVISSLTENNAHTVESLLNQIENDLDQGVTKFLLFPVPREKMKSNFDYGFILNATRSIKEHFGSKVWLAIDVCLCAYTTHGHCGILNKEGTRVLNHETVAVLSDYALQLASAGADCIAPSDMMDNRVAAIRKILDENNYDNIAIMGYSSKFSSSFYGPFRDVCKSAPGQNYALSDRKSYQLSPFDAPGALKAAYRDIADGADIVMVKPALPYLDVLHALKQETLSLLAAYHVSGEYQSLELMAQNGLLDRQRGHTEVWTAIKRAGADIIISYAARHARTWTDQIEY